MTFKSYPPPCRNFLQPFYLSVTLYACAQRVYSVVQEASVRIGIKGSWRLWFGKWVLYFHRMLHITYQVLEVLWPLTLSAKMWSRDLGSLLLASNGDRGILHNCWCLECWFSVRSTFPQLAMMKIQMIFTELITIHPSSIHKKLLPNYLNLSVGPPCKEGDPYENDAFLSRTCLWVPLPEWVKFFPVMFHINETFLNLPLYWYHYKKCRWRYIPVDLTSPFCTRLKKNFWS